MLDDESVTDEHFIGAFVCMAGDHEAGQTPDYLVIDGQQRIITFAILLSAIRDHADYLADGRSSPLGDEIHDKYLYDKYGEGLEQYCVVSRAEDRGALFTLLERGELSSSEQDTDIGEAYQYFSTRISNLVDEGGEEILDTFKSIIMQQLPLALITADESENPYAIFETLNERGVPLEESDLIRNYVFMQLDLDDQDQYNENHWKPFEKRFEGTDTHDSLGLTRFYRMYMMRNGEYVKKNGVYEAFQDRIDLEPHTLIDELNHFAELYIWIQRPDTAPTEYLSEKLQRYNSLSISSADPLLLHALDKFENDELERDGLERLFTGLESFAIRRSICGESTRGYFKIFPSAAGRLSSDGSIDSALKFLGKKGWPSDKRFREDLVTFDIYSRESSKARLMLKTFQCSFEHKEPVNLSELEIEHVLPQTVDPETDEGQAWVSSLGDDWEFKHDEWKHTLGNLTLTGYNPELSNKRFQTKLDEGLSKSHLELNEHFKTVDDWRVTQIRDRGEKLAQHAAKLWPVPDVASSESDDRSGYVVRLLTPDGKSIRQFENSQQKIAVAQTIEYLIAEEDLDTKISLPYIPGTGEGERAFLNSNQIHANGDQMRGQVELENGWFLFTKLNADEKQRYLREVSRKCNLICHFEGGW